VPYQEINVSDSMLGGVLSREQLRSLIVDAERPLLREYVDFEGQIQPNGVDLTLREVSRHVGEGAIGIDSSDRILPDLETMEFDGAGWLNLVPGCYHILYNEVVDIPETLMALGRPRSSLNRCGVTIHTAVWDAGYTGRSTSMLVVSNPAGFRIQRNARVMQLIFVGMSEATADGYRGRYQLENL
jgi:dUTP pyrophosphatase